MPLEQLKPQEERAVLLCMIIGARNPGVRCDRHWAFAQMAVVELEKAQAAVATSRRQLEELEAKSAQRDAELARAWPLLEQPDETAPAAPPTEEAEDEKQERTIEKEAEIALAWRVRQYLYGI